MAEAFVRTIKRDYVRVSPRPDAETVMRQLPAWIAHYNEVHPHKALGYCSPRGSSQLTQDPDRVRSFGATTPSVAPRVNLLFWREEFQ
jgi:transposase InsO family protein